MRVAKLFDTKKFFLLSKTIDKALLETDYPWHLDKMTFIMDDKNSFELKDGTAEIHFDYSILRHDDERYMKAIIMRILFSLMNELCGVNSGVRIIDEITANREMTRRGFGDDLFYYYYLSFAGKKGPHDAKSLDDRRSSFDLMSPSTDDFEKYIEINVPWISLDGYDSQALREMTDRLLSRSQYRKAFQRKAKKLFDVLAKDLKNEANLKEAVKWYKRKLGS